MHHRSYDQGVSVLGGFCLGGLCPRGLCPGGSLSGGVSIQGVSTRGDLCLGSQCPGGLERPPYGNELVVRIPLEYILVNFFGLWLK